MMSPWLGLSAAFLLVFVNAFFVASEFALLKIRPTRLEELVDKGMRRARIALGISRRIGPYLSATQLGITLASLGLGWLGEPAIAGLLEPLLRRLGIGGPALLHTVSIAVAFVGITFLHTVLGELAPKSLALAKTEALALATAAPLRAFYLAAFPLIWGLDHAADLSLRALGLARATDADSLHSPGELRMIVRRVHLDPGVRQLIDRVFDYTHRVARHVMTLRQDVVTLEADRPFDDNLKVAVSDQYTRYPLVEPESDRVLGYVHVKDLLAALAARRPLARMRELVREPIYAGEDTPLERLRRDFQRRRAHIAIIRNRDGAFAGIVTLEDLLEEFVGEIRDEHDAGEVAPIIQSLIGDGSFEADGRVTLDVAVRELGLKLEPPDGDVETLGGYVAARLGGSPGPGASIEVGGFRLTVMETRGRRVRRLRGTPVEPPGGKRTPASIRSD